MKAKKALIPDRIGSYFRAARMKKPVQKAGAAYKKAAGALSAAVVGAVMLLSASGKAEILTLFGMSVGTSVAVINYISRIFSPIESLGMEIQTIQSAMAGVKRIDAFLDQPERDIPKERENAARGDVVLSGITFGDIPPYLRGPRRQNGRDHTAQRKRACTATLRPQNGLSRSHRRASNVFIGCSPFHTIVTFCHKTYKLPDFSV